MRGLRNRLLLVAAAGVLVSCALDLDHADLGSGPVPFWPYPTEQTISFPTDTPCIDAIVTNVLKSWAVRLETYPEVLILVEGHAAPGPAAYDAAFGSSVADATKNELVAMCVAADRI